MTSEDQAIVEEFVREYPDWRVQYGPVFASIGGQAVVQSNTCVWIWRADNMSDTARCFFGENLRAALDDARRIVDPTD